MPLSAQNHSYFPHVLSSFSHDDFTRVERASLTLYYLVKNPLWISQALSLPFTETNLPYFIRTDVLLRATSLVSQQFINYIASWFGFLSCWITFSEDGILSVSHSSPGCPVGWMGFTEQGILSIFTTYACKI